ncbi:Type-1 restriction enzyme EcoKI specificity protein [compost metagenome]
MTNLSGANLNNGAAVGRQGESMDSPSRFPAYPAYKDSGVEWLGEVPAHWSVTRLGRISDVESGYPFPAEQFVDDGVPVTRMSDLKEGRVSFESIKKVAENNVPTKAMARVDDLLIGLSGSISNFAQIIATDLPLAVNQRVGIIRSENPIAAAVTKYFVLSRSFICQIESAVPETTILNISMEQVRSCALAWPTRFEQAQIARFLDHESARIDALIEEQQRLIELLKEKRQAVISHAVTKGLDPTVPMKDSGVEWLGEVPAHWLVGPLRWYATIQGGIAKGKDYEGRETVSLPYLRVANVQNGFVDLTEVKEISVLESEVERYSLRSGDVLMNEGGDNDKLGRGTVWQGQIEPCLHQNHVFAIRPNDLLSAEWLSAFTQCDQARSYFFLNSKQSTNLASISASNVMSLALPIPSVAEQKEILSILNQSRVAHEELVNLATSTVEFLKERRSALISAAVTGKIDVRGWQPPASIQSPESAVAEAV